MPRFSSFREFYPYYLSEHSQRLTRRLHFAGSTGALACVALAIARGQAWWLLGALASGYGMAWASHLLVEKNRPATFRHPWWSFLGDWAMYRDILLGRIRF